MSDFFEACHNTEVKEAYFQEKAQHLIDNHVPLPYWPDDLRVWAMAEIEANLQNPPPCGPAVDDLPQ